VHISEIFSDKQRRSFRESTAKINIWEGAVRSGKTYISIWRFIKELMDGPEGEYALICRTYDGFKRNVLRQFTDKLHTDAKYYGGKREINIYGKTVHIIGADDERAEAKIRGPTFMGAYVDEATIIPESVFKMLVSRCAMGGAKIFATTNPDSPYHWLKTNFLEGNLTNDEKQYLRRQYKGVWYQRFIEGMWVQAEGAIYDFFDTNVHIINHAPGPPDYYILGIDYGTSNPCAFVLIGVSTTRFPRVWVEEEYYFDSKKHQRQKTDAEYAEDLRKFLQWRRPRCIYVDPSAASFKQELYRGGFEGVYDAENEVIDGIRLVSNYLNQGTLKIARNCQNLINEFQSYVWDAKSAKTGIDKPLKENDHALDALRYALYTHFFAKPVERLTPNELEKIRLEALGGQTNLPRFFSDPIDPGGYQF
jgi:phage terminase large subunit